MFSYIFCILLGMSGTLIVIERMLSGNIQDSFNLKPKLNNIIDKNIKELFDEYLKELDSQNKKMRDIIEDYMDDINDKLGSCNDNIARYIRDHKHTLSVYGETGRASP